MRICATARLAEGGSSTRLSYIRKPNVFAVSDCNGFHKPSFVTLMVKQVGDPCEVHTYRNVCAARLWRSAGYSTSHCRQFGSAFAPQHPLSLDITVALSTYCFNAQAPWFFTVCAYVYSYDFRGCQWGVCNGLFVSCKVWTESETISTTNEMHSFSNLFWYRT
jgi:hypothetical protein